MKQRGYTTLNVKKIYTFYSLYLTDHDILAIDESCLHHAQIVKYLDISQVQAVILIQIFFLNLKHNEEGRGIVDMNYDSVLANNRQHVVNEFKSKN